MGYAPERHGPRRPIGGLAPLDAGWARWTYVADSWSPNGLGESPVRCRAAARAVHRTPEGAWHDDGRVALRLDSTDMERAILSIEVIEDGRPLDLEDLVGASVAGGFRGRLAAVTAPRGGLSPLVEFLLDDLPGITLVASYAFQWEDTRTGRDTLTKVMTEFGDAAIDFQSGTCAGWAEEATLITTLRRKRDLLTPIGAPAPSLWDDGEGIDAGIDEGDDAGGDAGAGMAAAEGRGEDGWAERDPLRTDATRRIRRIDLGPAVDGVRPFVTHFRDSHADVEGTERVLHEYLVTGTMCGGVIESLTPEARVLPWVECPGALASAARAVGQRADGLRTLVRAEFRGTSTCTHLNDTVRSLESLAAMQDILERSGG